MTLGKKIKDLRIEKGLTQEKLAELLYVTAQAVSRWENGYVDPNIDTLKSMAQIFGVTVDELLSFEANEAKSKEVQSEKEKEVVVVATQTNLDDVKNIVNEAFAKQKKQIALCCNCNKPIYEGEDIYRLNPSDKNQTFCKACKMKLEKEKNDAMNQTNRKWRIFAWIFMVVGMVVALTIAIVTGVNATKAQDKAIAFGAGIPIAIGFGFFLYCVIAKNNFMNEMVHTVIDWGFVKFPGLIASFDIDGLIWIICMKVLFYIIGFILVAGFTLLAVAIGIALSYFVFPFAVYRSYKRPDLLDAD